MESLIKQMTNEKVRAMAGEPPHTPTNNKKVSFASARDVIVARASSVHSSQRSSSHNEDNEEIDLEQGFDSAAGDFPFPNTAARGFFREKSHAIRSQRKLNVDTGSVQDKECMVEIVSGLLEPMNPLERRRKEFLTSEKSRLILSQKSGDQLQYRLRSKTVRMEKERLEES